MCVCLRVFVCVHVRSCCDTYMMNIYICTCVCVCVFARVLVCVQVHSCLDIHLIYICVCVCDTL